MNSIIKKVLFTEEQLDSIITGLANQINRDYNGKDLILVALLKGSIVFLADLMRKITIPCRIDFMSVSSYTNGATKSTGRVKINFDVTQSVENSDVLIVEDIIDSGHTLDYMLRYFQVKKANSVKICTLLNKPSRREVNIPVDYIGIEIEDEFVLGYGLDYIEYYRNLPYIGVIKPEAIN